MSDTCCDLFKANYFNEHVYTRGLSVVRKNNGFYFLRFSAVDGQNKERFLELLNSIKDRPSFHLSIDGDLAIHFCPWCGADLRRS